MAALEGVLLSVGKAVATRAASIWLDDRRLKQERTSDLSKLIQSRFSDRFQQRGVERQLESIADDVAQRLEPFRIAEFGGLPNNERLAALNAVIDTFMAADLGDESFFAADGDPIRLSRQLRATTPNAVSRSLLSEPAAYYYDLVLAQCCDCYVRIVLQLKAFPPRAIAESLSRLSSLSDQVGQVLKRLPAPTLDAPSGTGQDDEFSRRYLEFISTSLDRVELFGVDLRHRSLATLSVAYLSLSVSSEAGDEPTSTSGQKDPAQSGVARIEAILPRSRRLLLRGEAGSGKTTLLRWLAITAARGGFTERLADWNGYIPFLITLRSYAERQLPSPEEFLDDAADMIAGLTPINWAHRQLSGGRCLILVDGVDEVPEARRSDVRSWISQLTNAYPQVRLLVTARPAAAEVDWLAAERFSTVRLEPMAPDDIRRLVIQWHEAVRDAGHLPCDVDELPIHRQTLLSRLESNSRLRLLATSPLLCAMLCALNLDRRGYLPRNRMELYAAALQMLLERRDSQRGLRPARGLDFQQRQAILRDLAWRLAIRQESEAPREKVIAWIRRRQETLQLLSVDPEALLNNLLERSGLLREPIPGRIDFVHRTFLEYLAAEEAAEEDHIELLVQRAHESNWQEIIVLAAGHANSPLRRELLAGLLNRVRGPNDRSPNYFQLLIVRCLETVTAVPEDLLGEIEECVANILPPKNPEHLSALAAGGDAVLHRLPSDLLNLNPFESDLTIHLVSLINGPEALQLLASYSEDQRVEVQRELQSAWSRFDADEYAQKVLAKGPLMDGLVLAKDAAQTHAARRYLKNCSHLGLESIDFDHSLEVLDKCAPLQLLIASGSYDELGWLRTQPTLQYIVLAGLNGVTDYTPFKYLPKLSVLILTDCKNLSNLTFLGSCHELRYLAIFHAAPVLDVSALADHKNLELRLSSYQDVAGQERLGSGVHFESVSHYEFPTDLRRILAHPSEDEWSPKGSYGIGVRRADVRNDS
jgi:hypothetical protein